MGLMTTGLKDNPEFIRKKRISGRKCDLKRNYGITEEEYDKLLKAQDFKCAICEKTEEKSGRKLSVDHCHTSNNIRGVLCTACNTALGKFKDDVHLLEMAIKIITHNKAFDRSIEMAQGYKSKALKALSKAPDNDLNDTLSRLTSFVINRAY